MESGKSRSRDHHDLISTFVTLFLPALWYMVGQELGIGSKQRLWGLGTAFRQEKKRRRVYLGGTTTSSEEKIISFLLCHPLGS